MTKPNTMSRFERLRSTMKKSNKSLRIKLLKNFTAVQSGDDFGDALLDIGESKTINDEQKEKILDTIESCRKSILSITKLYQKNDAQFKREYTLAANERLTDALTVFSEIAKNGYAEADLDWAGTPKLDYNAAIEALRYEANSLRAIAGTIRDVQDGKDGAFAETILKPNPADQRLNRSLYNLYSPDYGYVQIYTRPEGSHSFDPTLEYGKARNKYDENATNTGVEASISMMTNPVDPFAIPNPFRPNRHGLKDPNFYDKSTMNKVSAIRLDREGRAPGLSADDERRDPTNYIGTISVDLAAIGDREDTPSGKIARLLAVGNAIRSKERKTEASLNHNTNHFDQEKYGIASGFSGLVHSLDALLINLVKEHPPKNDEGLTNILKRASRKTGRVAIESAAISEAS